MCLSPLHAQEADLEKIQSALKTTKAELLKKEQLRSTIYSELKEQEEAISESTKALNNTQIKLTQNKVERDDLNSQKIILGDSTNLSHFMRRANHTVQSSLPRKGCQSRHLIDDIQRRLYFEIDIGCT